MLSSSIYDGKVMAAPMVRISSLAFRIMCAHFGADVAFSEEIVAAKLCKASREVVKYDVPVDLAVGCSSASFSPVSSLGNSAASPTPTVPISVVEFVVYENYKNMIKRQVVFAVVNKAVHPGGEGCQVVVQIGAADPDIAAAAALVVCEDVDGIDVNMGCPKKFSIDNGMGAALMKDPPRAGKILRRIDEAVNSPERIASRKTRRIPISFKTRVFHDVEESVDQLKTVLSVAGGCSVVHAITLHARTRDQLSETAPLLEHAREVVARCKRTHPDLFANICFVFNGSVLSRDEARSFLHAETVRGGSGTTKDCCCFRGALIARSAMWDPSVFREGRVGPFFTDDRSTVDDALEVYRRMLAVHRYYHTNFTYVKYHLTRSFQEFPAAKKYVHPKMQMARTYGDFARILGYDSATADSCFGNVTFEELLTSPAAAGGHVTTKRPRDDGSSC